MASDGWRGWKLCGRAGDRREPVPLPRGSGRCGAYGCKWWSGEDV